MSTRPELYNFHGVAMTHCVTDNWEKVRNFQARLEDILIATYPKAGTTWVSYILDLLYFEQLSSERQTSIPIHERVPFLEIAVSSEAPGTEMADKLPTSLRLIKTHLPVQLVPQSFWDQNCRMVYVARNAKDNMVSFYHFDCMNLVQPEPGESTSYFQRFLDGQKREIDKLCSFFGLFPSAEQKMAIVERVHFDNMKKNDMANCSKLSFLDFKISHFLRNGKVGDWKNHITVAQNEVFDKDYKRKMKDPTLLFRTEI